jgi:anti-anti-sigma factor
LTSQQLSRTLREAQRDARLVVLDLREVTFMDSAGVHAILDAAAEARREWGPLMLVRGSVPVERIFTLTKATDEGLIFDFEPSAPHRALRDSHETSVRSLPRRLQTPIAWTSGRLNDAQT